MLGLRWNLSICQFPVIHWTDHLRTNMTACTLEGKWKSEREREKREILSIIVQTLAATVGRQQG